MDVSKGDVVERLARVLTAQRLSINGEGDLASAGDRVDAEWRDHRADAITILKALREPDRAMAAAGDPAIWSRMIAAALAE